MILNLLLAVAATNPAPDAIKDCEDCPLIVAVPGASRLGFNYAMRYELTWREYGKAVREAGCAPPLSLPERLDATFKRKQRASPDDARFSSEVAVSGISPADAQCYVRWLNAKTGKSYKLPSPSQWRFLAYGKARTAYPWGDHLPTTALSLGTLTTSGVSRKRSMSALTSPRA